MRWLYLILFAILACGPHRNEPVCGDGVLAATEECDDGNTTNGDNCDNNCTFTRCGNGIQTQNEECDDGNLLSDDGCAANCSIERCGDSIVQPSAGEECDDGDAGNTASGRCLPTCKAASCGDGNLRTDISDPNNPLFEECDDGNLSNNDLCPVTCHLAFCGDGFALSGVEACDDGNQVDTDACHNDCTLPPCGNGLFDPNEECEDGNVLNGDGCSSVCSIERTCGDGRVSLGEQCDDSNLVNGDDCSSTCQSTPVCNAACSVATCGDGVVQPGEVCFDFSQLIVGRVPTAAQGADFDGDSDIDMAVVAGHAHSISILLNDGNANFTLDTIISLSDQSDFGDFLAVGDIDGNNTPDIIAGNTESSFADVYLNFGGSFSFDGQIAVPALTSFLDLIDVDSDGDLDFFAYPFGGTGKLFINDGAGFFTISPGLLPPNLFRFGDFNGDSFVDIVKVLSANDNIQVFFNDGNNNFALVQQFPCFNSFTNITPVFDMDGDLDLDLVISSSGGNQVRTFVNEGNGHFTPGPSSSTTDENLQPFDVDGDNDFDLVGEDGSNTRLLINNGSGNFTVGASLNKTFGGFIIQDLNGDSNIDLAAIQGGQIFETILNQAGVLATPQFVEIGEGLATGRSVGSVALGDLDNDGDIDMVTSNNFTKNLTIITNSNSGTLTITSLIPVTNTPNGIVVGDVDNDGDLDIVFQSNFDATSDGHFTVLLQINGSFVETVIGTVSLPLERVPELIDLSNDGNLDIVISGQGKVLFFESNGDGTFAPEKIIIPEKLGDRAFKDMDGDGDIDLVIFDNLLFADDLRLYDNDGLGNLSLQATFPAFNNAISLVSEDWDINGSIDLAFVSRSTTDQLNAAYRQLGDVFDMIPYGLVSGSGFREILSSNDFDADSDPDIALMTDVEFVIFKNNHGAFSRVDVTSPTNFNGIQMLTGDINQDSVPDIVMANGADDGLNLLLSNP